MSMQYKLFLSILWSFLNVQILIVHNVNELMLLKMKVFVMLAIQDTFLMATFVNLNAAIIT